MGVPGRGWMDRREKERLAKELGRLTLRELAEIENDARRIAPGVSASSVSQYAAMPFRKAASLVQAIGGALARWFGVAPVEIKIDEDAGTIPPRAGEFVQRSGVPPIVDRTPRDEGPILGGIPPIPDKSQGFVEPHPTEDAETVYQLGSSNVFAFRYDEPTLTFYVQFLGGSGDARSGPGPTYAYYGVTPERAAKVLDSDSAGGAVWSYFRIRGTRDGHQVDYSLVRASPNGYVPRKETGRGLVRRTVRENGKVLRSPKRGTGQFSGD